MRIQQIGEDFDKQLIASQLQRYYKSQLQFQQIQIFGIVLICYLQIRSKYKCVNKSIFLKEFLRLVDIQSLNPQSIDEHIEQLKTQLLQSQCENEFLKEEQNFNAQFEFPELENPIKQKIKKKQGKREKNNSSNKKFNHPSSLSRHKKNQHKNVKLDMMEVKQLNCQQQEFTINLTDLEI